MSRRREPMTVVMNYYTSTPNKYRYRASAVDESEALGDIYLAIDAVGGEAPRTIEVTVRFM